MRRLRKLGSDSRGATAVEYGLILALVFLAMVGAVRAFAQGTIGLWNHVTEEVKSG
jgi:pilus assembly protein Flp/PilA